MTTVTIAERAVVFACGDERLVAVMSRPQQPSARGVLVVVGGPQYRAGSHRQFTLLCRALAEQGIAAMRFDYRGMGDSEGAARNFEDIDLDIRAAVDCFCAEVSELRHVVLWGLCDAASAALMYAHRDARIAGLVLLNPWVRTAEGLAKAQLKHYYGSRLVDREFWRKVVRGDLDFAAALRSFGQAVLTALGMRKAQTAAEAGDATLAPAAAATAEPLPHRMAQGLSRFKGRVLLILSGNDLTAQEFEDVAASSAQWRGLLADTRVVRHKLPQATHTFSTREWRDQVALWTADWVRSW